MTDQVTSPLNGTQPMPEMNTMFSFGTPKSGITFWVWARIE